MSEAKQSKLAELLKSKTGKRLLAVLGVLLVPALLYNWVYPVVFDAYTGVRNAPLNYPSSLKLTDAEFDQLALELTEEARYRQAAAVVEEDQDGFARELKIEMLMNTRSVIADGGYNHIKYFRDAGTLRNLEPHWMRQMGTLMVNHGIQRQGHDCTACRSPDGILDFDALGYPAERVAELQSMDLVEEIVG
jgi:hypothetical protein